MKRWLFSLAAAFSVLVFVAVLGLAIYSYFTGVRFQSEQRVLHSPRGANTSEWRLMLCTGGLRLESSRKWNGFASDVLDTQWTRFRPQGYPKLDRGWQFMGFGWYSESRRIRNVSRYEARDWGFVLPLWLPLLVSGVLPAIWLWRRFGPARRRRMRLAAGLCVKCGYDLRASYERCPECGAGIPGDTVRKPIS